MPIALGVLDGHVPETADTETTIQSPGRVSETFRPLYTVMSAHRIGAIWTKGLNFNFSATGPSPKIPLKYLGLALTVEFAACAEMYFIAEKYRVLSEAEQQINRVWLTSLGKRPYIDFEWPWGPFFLYVPRWISELLHLTIPQGYFLFWILTSLIGITLLYATINLVDFPSAHKTSIFFLLFLFAMLTVMSPFRVVPQRPVSVHLAAWPAFMEMLGLGPLTVIPKNGQGLNILLQNLWMTIHPPIMFMGFTSTLIPCALALGALVKRDWDGWVQKAMPWAVGKITLFVGCRRSRSASRKALTSSRTPAR